jgi:cytochrome subunit of sulfide dehydrogenase
MVFLLNSKNTMKNAKFWFLARLILATFITSVSLPIAGNAAEVFVYSADHIRTLAASCAACHGSIGNSIGNMPTLAGIDSKYFATQMLAFKNGSRPATVMHHHAKGLTVDEINRLATHFSQQIRTTNSVPKTQSLKADHD